MSSAQKRESIKIENEDEETKLDIDSVDNTAEAVYEDMWAEYEKML